MTESAIEGTIPRWTLTDRLRKAREQRGLTQAELAALTEISARSIHNYEVGRSTPKKPHLMAWAFATGVPLAWLEQSDEPSAEEVRPKGFEPLTFWSGVSQLWAIAPFLRTDDLALTA